MWILYLCACEENQQIDLLLQPSNDQIFPIHPAAWILHHWTTRHVSICVAFFFNPLRVCWSITVSVGDSQMGPFFPALQGTLSALPSRWLWPKGRSWRRWERKGLGSGCLLPLPSQHHPLNRVSWEMDPLSKLALFSTILFYRLLQWDFFYYCDQIHIAWNLPF